MGIAEKMEKELDEERVEIFGEKGRWVGEKLEVVDIAEKMEKFDEVCEEICGESYEEMECMEWDFGLNLMLEQKVVGFRFFG